MYLWRYSKAKEDLERACGEGIFVATLVPLRRKGSTHVGTAYTYTQGIPTIVPDSEWVILVGKKKGFSLKKRKQEVEVMSARTFVELLAEYVKPYEWPDPRVRIIGPESAQKAGKITSNIDRTLQRSEFDAVEGDAFVDIKLPTSG